MRVIGIDPGAKAGIVCVSFPLDAPPCVLAVGEDARGLRAEMVVCEAQFPNPKAGRQSLIALGATAGYLLGLHAGCGPTYRIPVAAWRRALWGTAGQEPKAVVLARLAAVAREGVWLSTDDELEAFGIACAAAKLGQAKMQAFAWPKPRRARKAG